MAISGTIRHVHTAEDIECHHCESRALFEVAVVKRTPSSKGIYDYYCKDHFEDLKDGTLKEPVIASN